MEITTIKTYLSTPIPVTLNNPPNPQTREDIIDALNVPSSASIQPTADSSTLPCSLIQPSTHGNVMSGLPTIHKDCYDNISKMATTHILSNIRVSIVEGDENKAKVTASALAQHYRPGE
ncbi:hypothetical protein AtubIFM57258_007187 [Aspergillus tubingensis]|nr:hypothetical protein AtubIFM57258_007187 [Aspergillus tubingensis]